VNIGIGLYLAKKFDKQHPEQIDKGSYKVHVCHPMNHERPMEDDWQHVKQKLIARAPGKSLDGTVTDIEGRRQWILVEEVRSYDGRLLFYKPVWSQDLEGIQGRVDELVHPAKPIVSRESDPSTSHSSHMVAWLYIHLPRSYALVTPSPSINPCTPIR
jgi:hypothetical protein